MAFSDYLDLRTAVVEAVGNDAIVEVFDRLAKLAETNLSRKLRTRWQISEAAVTVAGGTAALPADFAELSAMFDASGKETVPDIFGSIRAPDGNYTLRYFAKVPTITGGGVTATTWLLAEAPDAYLYAIAAEAAKWLRDVEGAAAFSKLREDAIEDLREYDGAQRFARARVRVQGPTP